MMAFFGLLLYVSVVCIYYETSLAQIKPFLIDCGSNSSTDADGRTWIGDSTLGGNFNLSNPGIVALNANVSSDSVYASLYRTVRTFDTPSLYNFSVHPGIYCIRLHFCPFSYGSLNATNSFFDVRANELKLLSKFNVPFEISRKSMSSNSAVTSLMKEYFISINSDELEVAFSPIVDSFAFVNAIEVIPILKDVFVDYVTKVGSKEKSPVSLNNRGIETMYRLNVGGPSLNSGDDHDLWRKWDSDESFMFSVYAAKNIHNSSIITYLNVDDSFVAPLLVYETAREMTDNEVVEKSFNVSWTFYVDPNFDYLVRLHFCELVYDRPDQRMFRIYINNRTAADNYDIFVRAQGMNKAYHDDYVDLVPQQIDTLWIQLGPDSSASASGTDALLNGLEIFKLSRNGNLAHVAERIITGGEVSGTKKPARKFIWTATSVGVLSLITASVVFIFFVRRNKKKKETSIKENPPGWRPLVLHETLGSTTNAGEGKFPLTSKPSMSSNRLGRHFTLAEIKFATKNFDESLVIGSGGFGKVYKGEIDDGNLVAIKRGHPNSNQGLTEFETEIEMLSKLRHRHLVTMVGYCEEQNEMILVYEFMANGTFRSHLYGGGRPPLSWKQRIDICIGAARGLHYLHTGAERGIIHRDVKTTNILLDQNFVAKMADFGLSKAGPALDHTHVSTAVKGSFGYLDPEYFRRQHLTQKSDVYSFGVVLFEVVCARPVINPSLPKDRINLAEWALRWQRQRSLESIVDPHLEGDYSLESLKKFGEIAEKCLADEGKNRPTIGEVLWQLEYALQLHEAYKRGGDGDSFGSSDLVFADMSLHHLGEQAESSSKSSSIVYSSRQSKEEGHRSNYTLGVGFSKNVNHQGR